jgi:large subunit ribosomal protein L19
MKKAIIDFNLSQRTKKMPDFQSGDIVKIHRKIIEGGKELKQVFGGIVIAIKGGQSSSPMITVRKVSKGVGVELILPVFSPNISKIEVVKRAKIRRAKLYYIRNKSSKSLKMKYKEISDIIVGDEPETEVATEETKKPETKEKEAK